MTDKTAEKEKRKSLILDGEIAERVEALADGEHRSFTNMVEVLLFEAMNHRASVQNESPSMT